VRSCSIAAVAFALACGDSPTETGPDINPGLLETAGDATFGQSGASGLPQGSAPFTGPGGLSMDATAEEFVQQLTLDNGVVWRTSGISVRAVPDESVSDSSIAAVRFGPAHPGSLASVTTGSYPITALPQFDFLTPVMFATASFRPGGTRTYTYANTGVVTIESLNYFNDVYTCQLTTTALIIDTCEYKLGLLRGVIEFSIALEGGGEIVQQRTPFTVPIMRRTIIARMK
jgi:hypothetical protein